VRTGPDGRYRIPVLAVGVYTIRCEKAGFQRAEMPQVYLSLNQTLEQTIHLKLATADNSIDVTAEQDALNTTAPTAGVGLGGESSKETPSGTVATSVGSAAGWLRLLARTHFVPSRRA
jgi:hypothetical protein